MSDSAPMVDRPLSGIALFCEDIRFERGGQVSLVGVWPGRILVDETPIAIPRVGIFIRLRIPAMLIPRERAFIRVHQSGGRELERFDLMDKDKIARLNELKTAGELPENAIGFDGAAEIVLDFIQIDAEGDLIASLLLDGREQEIDRLRFRLSSKDGGPE